jgi:outer membrane protein assembly factor BamE (lipoprotein component of BamABCDE complex)
MKDTARHGLRACLLALSLFAVACRTSEMASENIVIGTTTLDQIEKGCGRRFVIALLGEPMQKIDLGSDRELWTWGYKERESAGGSKVLIIDNRPRTETSHAAYVEFDDGRVLRAWRD